MWHSNSRSWCSNGIRSNKFIFWSSVIVFERIIWSFIYFSIEDHIRVHSITLPTFSCSHNFVKYMQIKCVYISYFFLAGTWFIKLKMLGFLKVILLYLIYQKHYADRLWALDTAVLSFWYFFCFSDILYRLLLFPFKDAPHINDIFLFIYWRQSPKFPFNHVQHKGYMYCCLGPFMIVLCIETLLKLLTVFSQL